MPSKASESAQVQKARKKLEKQLAQEKKMINQKALTQMKKLILQWIKRHETERVKLSDRLELFDENRHSEKAKSKFVEHLSKRLQNEATKTQSFKPLIGRIKK